eukprot:6302328-Prymnesium_polylepis.1
MLNRHGSTYGFISFSNKVKKASTRCVPTCLKLLSDDSDWLISTDNTSLDLSPAPASALTTQ